MRSLKGSIVNRILGWFAVLAFGDVFGGLGHKVRETVVTDSLGRAGPCSRSGSQSRARFLRFRSSDVPNIMEKTDTLVGITEQTKTRKGEFPESGEDCQA